MLANSSSGCSPCKQEKTNIAHNAPRIISEDVAFLMNSTLMDVIQIGTGRRARELNRHDIAGKTGTTNDQYDAWFTGYNPDLVVSTWIGFDTPQSLHEYGAQLALPLWIDFMKVALKGKPEHLMKQPENIVTAKINPKTGLRTTAESGITEYFRKDEIPGTDDSTIASDNSMNVNQPTEDLF